MAKALQRSLNLELQKAFTKMAKGKSSDLDGIMVELYRCMWPVFGDEYLNMLLTSIERKALPNEVTKGLIVLLHKGGGCNTLNNWRPITLFNVSYKILARTLQICL
jgi:hypothetical protein